MLGLAPVTILPSLAPPYYLNKFIVQLRTALTSSEIPDRPPHCSPLFIPVNSEMSHSPALCERGSAAWSPHCFTAGWSKRPTGSVDTHITATMLLLNGGPMCNTHVVIWKYMGILIYYTHYIDIYTVSAVYEGPGNINTDVYSVCMWHLYTHNNILIFNIVTTLVTSWLRIEQE